MHDSNDSIMEDISISPNGIAKLIDNLKISTSVGTDNIPFKIVKNTKNVSQEVVCLLFNQSLYTGVLYENWKEGKVILIIKNDDRYSPSNCHSISVATVLCKLCEHILFTCTINLLETNCFFASINMVSARFTHQKWNCSNFLIASTPTLRPPHRPIQYS